MIDKILRVHKEAVLTPLVRGPFQHMHPTHVTLLAALCGIAAAGAAWQSAWALALGLWVLNRVLDGLDGTLARVNGTHSDLGGYLDIMLDHVVYVALPLGLALAADSAAAFLALALLLASFYINAASWMYLSALLEKRHAGASAQAEVTAISMPGGLIEGAETILFYTLFLLFPGALIPLFGLMAVLVLFTAGQRVVWAIRSL